MTREASVWEMESLAGRHFTLFENTLCVCFSFLINGGRGRGSTVLGASTNRNKESLMD